MTTQPVPAASLADPAEVFDIILDPERRGELYPYYHRLRELAPVHPTTALNNEQAFVLTRYQDIDSVLRNPHMFSDQRGAEIFNTGRSGEKFYRMMRRLLLYLDPPEHDRIRALLARAFTPRAVELRRPRVQQVVDDLLDQVEGKNSFDLVADFAYPLPIVVICEMLGVPAEDLPRFYGWAHGFARRGDISDVTPERIRVGEEATEGFRGYFLELIDECRKRPRDDLMTALVQLEDEQGPISDEDLVASCVILLQAGHETTADLIGLGTLALLRNPDQLALLKRDPELIDDAVEELLRYDTSVQISQRVGTEDLELAGVKIPAGQVCVMITGAANRDPAVFADPDRLDLTRRPRQHLSFGLGRHVCLGSSLARAEIHAAVSTLLRRHPELALAGEPEFRPSLFLRGLKSLPLTS
jgi:cytochrome P450